VLHADIVMTLNDIFAYFAYYLAETGWFKRNLAEDVEWEKGDPIKFSARSLEWPRRN